MGRSSKKERNVNAKLAIAGGVGIGALLLAGCGSSADSASSSPTASPTASSSGAAGQGECPVSINEAWVKAAESGMTAAFADIDNNGDKPVTITAAATTAAGMTELHQTVDVNGTPTMQQVSSFEVPANGQLTLEPGADHIMLMQLTAPIQAGEDINITLTCKDAGEVTFAAQARTYQGANETYAPSNEVPGMDMGSSPTPGM